MKNEENYDFDIQQGGARSVDILDVSFNETTKQFIKHNGIMPGMKVLDVGCGSGVMSRWLAAQVGNEGQVVAIDNNEFQIETARNETENQGISNIQYELFSAYDIKNLHQTFDLRLG